MNVTLIFPGIASTGCDRFKKQPTVDADFIDHGLASVSASAKAAGHRIDLIDLRTLRDWQYFRKAVREKDSQVWDITSRSLYCPDEVRCVRVIKEEWEDAVVVLGGVHAMKIMNR